MFMFSINAYVKKLEKQQVNTRIIHLKELQKQQQSNPKISRKKKEITKIREEISQIETKRTIQMFMVTCIMGEFHGFQFFLPQNKLCF